MWGKRRILRFSDEDILIDQRWMRQLDALASAVVDGRDGIYRGQCLNSKAIVVSQSHLHILQIHGTKNIFQRLDLKWIFNFIGFGPKISKSIFRNYIYQSKFYVNRVVE